MPFISTIAEAILCAGLVSAVLYIALVALSRIRTTADDQDDFPDV